jgi:hypothetical protein
MDQFGRYVLYSAMAVNARVTLVFFPANEGRIRRKFAVDERFFFSRVR